MLVNANQIADQRDKCKQLSTEMANNSKQLTQATEVSKSLMIDPDEEYDMDSRINRSKPVLESSLNDVHDLYEKAKNLEDSVQILRRSNKKTTYLDYVVKIFVVGWLSAVLSFISGKWSGQTRNESLARTKKCDGNNTTITSSSMSKTHALNDDGQEDEFSRMEMQQKQHLHQLQSSSKVDPKIINNAHNLDGPASSASMNGLRPTLVSGEQKKNDLMKVALSNLEAMSRTISMLRENDESSNQDDNTIDN
ncbi:hypothetical protein SAMD00019534_059740 [Acytostelium subglobosum LB1]|uniref:hypothetical protein n=1 Tax=Acytostelium subglobosum LB1 TaxID=1410327 RepID=UPI0006449F9D|nr:hypothetical protein SAMD00019534_059740 [Acytostelium subglobosum LB1]GAM22799.1 hypothetical protein SAMD00019534_059740 [Acytostelium subglobosum LB1]|eukprot:XP_012754026.1 hypothetical protein SAMD00019534_059740 [Acytostelium subglobosum LB1]